MADNVTYSSSDNTGVPAGTVQITDQVGSTGGHMPIVKLALSADGSTTLVTVNANGLFVQGSVAHDSTGAGNPVPIGAKAVNGALSTSPVANLDRADLLSDRFGRLLTAEIDPDAQWAAALSYTTQATGTAHKTPSSSGRRLATTHLNLTSYSTTEGQVTIFYSSSGDTTYTEGTDRCLFDGVFVPSAASKPGAILAFKPPIYSTGDNYSLRITTSTSISVRVQAFGFEYTA